MWQPPELKRDTNAYPRRMQFSNVGINNKPAWRILVIVDLRLNGRDVVIIGGGGQALKKAKEVLHEECRVTILCNTANAEIEALAMQNRIKLVMCSVTEPRTILDLKPFLVISATNDPTLNRSVVSAASNAGILAYAADLPQESDFAGTCSIHVKNASVAVSTRGKSPIMAKKIADAIKPAVTNAIPDSVSNMILIQETAREIARDAISEQSERRQFLHHILADPALEKMAKEGTLEGVRKQIANLLNIWNVEKTSGSTT